MKRIVADFTTSDDRDFGVEKIDEATKNAAFGLAAQAEQNEIVAREKRIDDLRDYGVVVAMNAREDCFVALDGAKEIGANFVFDGALKRAGIEVGYTAEFADCFRAGMRRRRVEQGACVHLSPKTQIKSFLQGLKPPYPALDRWG